MPEERSRPKVKLLESRGATSVFIEAEISEMGDLVVSGQDVGDAPMEFFDDSDYEYWLTVRAEHKDAVLLALIEKLFKDDDRLVTKLRALLEAKGIPCEFSSYA